VEEAACGHCRSLDGPEMGGVGFVDVVKENREGERGGNWGSGDSEAFVWVILGGKLSRVPAVRRRVDKRWGFGGKWWRESLGKRKNEQDRRKAIHHKIIR